MSIPRRAREVARLFASTVGLPRPTGTTFGAAATSCTFDSDSRFGEPTLPCPKVEMRINSPDSPLRLSTPLIIPNLTDASSRWGVTTSARCALCACTRSGCSPGAETVAIRQGVITLSRRILHRRFVISRWFSGGGPLSALASISCNGSSLFADSMRGGRLVWGGAFVKGWGGEGWWRGGRRDGSAGRW